MNSIKSQMVIDYITKVNKAISNSMVVVEKEDIFDLLIEIANVFQNEIPEIQSSILLRNGTETRDANTVVGLLKLYLANNNIEYKEDDEENREIKRFWASFILWFETELINLDLLKDKYLRWDNWDGGTWYLELDYDYEFKLYRGIGYPDSLKNNMGDMSDIKNFIEIIYVFLTIFLYLLKCPQSLILSALRAFCFCGKPHISRSIFLYFRYQAWLKSW